MSHESQPTTLTRGNITVSINSQWFWNYWKFRHAGTILGFPSRLGEPLKLQSQPEVIMDMFNDGKSGEIVVSINSQWA